MAASIDNLLLNTSEIIKAPVESQEIHTDIVKEVMVDLIQHMKGISETFTYFQPEVRFTGSQMEELKITKADEYDAIIVLHIPHDSLHLDWSVTLPGHTTVSVLPKSILGEQQESSDWADSDGRLRRERVQIWFGGIVDKGLALVSRVAKGYRVSYYGRRIPGRPSFPFQISGGPIDGRLQVNITASFQLPFDRMPKNDRFNSITRNIESKEALWYVIPKGSIISVSGEDIIWYMMFQPLEKELLKPVFLPTIRLMKKFRDKQGIRMSTYCIKTLFFWEIYDRNFDLTFWHNSSQTDLFKHMLKKLQSFLLDKNIPNFWFPQQNLLPISKIPKERVQKWIRSIAEILKTTDPVVFLEFLLFPDEIRRVDTIG